MAQAQRHRRMSLQLPHGLDFGSTRHHHKHVLFDKTEEDDELGAAEAEAGTHHRFLDPILHKTSTIAHRGSGAWMDEDILLDPLRKEQAVHVGCYPNGPIDRVKRLITDHDGELLELEHEDSKDDDKTATSTGVKPLFCEFMEYMEDDGSFTKPETLLPKTKRLYSQDSSKSLPAEASPLNPDDVRMIWAESSRWVKYEETVEDNFTRFSKPHITLLQLQNVLQIKNCLRRGVSLLDIEANSFKQLIAIVAEEWRRKYSLTPVELKNVRKALKAPKLHMFHSHLTDLTSDSAVEQSSRSKSVDEEQNGKADTNGEEEGEEEYGKSKRYDRSLLKKLEKGSESALVLVGFLNQALPIPVAAFIRLQTAKLWHPEVPELPVPIRFVFVLLIPREHYYHEIKALGQCIGTMLIDDAYSRVIYKARAPSDLTDGIDEFLSQSVIVPAGKWNPTQRWEPQEDMAPVSRNVGQLSTAFESSAIADAEHEHREGLERTGRLFGGLINDFKRKGAVYVSDYTDAFRGRVTQMIAGAILLFFANVTKIITFGGVMAVQLDGNMGAVENLLSGGVCGVVYALFAGQPLAVLSATGPTLVFEYILYFFCNWFGWPYLPARFWVGVWTAIILIVLVATDASVFVALITRFTEEAFATLISVIFIYQAIEELFHIVHFYPLTTDVSALLSDPCVCNATGVPLYPSSNITAVESCSGVGEAPMGMQCNYKPDVFLFSVILCVGTFVIAIGMKFFRHSSFFSSPIRNGIADFGVFIAIVAMTALNHFVGLDVDGLAVPKEFKPTIDRPWLVNPLGMGLDRWWVILVAFLPAFFFTILVFMDQQITAVIVNRPDNKLVKGAGYHLDLLVISSLMFICALFGIPFYVAATVISILHIDSLREMSPTAAPGEKPVFLGIKEQRVTALVAHIFIGLAVFLTPVIKLVPFPVLLGIFLYMGVVSLIGQQLVQRIFLLFMPMKHQPDYPWLRAVHLKRVHLFTLFQIVGFALLYAVKSVKTTSMLFPLMLIVLIGIRFLMGRVFTKTELCALDDPLPTFKQLLEVKKKDVDEEDKPSNDIKLEQKITVA